MRLDSITFYNIEKAIKSYRMMAQRNLKNAGFSITIDQWLVMKALHENPNANQNEIGSIVFKDAASVTRIIESLVQQNYLKRTVNNLDRRKSIVQITESAYQCLNDMDPIIQNNRAVALKNIIENELETTNNTLKKIANNCNI